MTRRQTGQLMDSYFYFSMARSLQDGEGPRVQWPQGPHTKFFPGYPILLALASTVSGLPPDLAYVWLNAALLLIVTLLLLALASSLVRLSPSARPMHLLWPSLVLANVVFIRWFVMPMAETAALACVLAQALFVRSLRRRLLGRRLKAASRLLAFLSLGILGGFGAITRAEVVFFLPILILVLRGPLNKNSAPPARTASWALLGLGYFIPFAGWLLWQRFALDQTGIYYIAEGRQNFAWSTVVSQFVYLLNLAVRIPNILSSNPLVNLFHILLQCLLVAALVLSLAGAWGRCWRHAALCLILYWIAHGFWYYESERFNLLVIPIVVALLWRGLFLLTAAHRKKQSPTPRAKVLLTLLLIPALAVQLSFGMLAIQNQFDAIARQATPRAELLELRESLIRSATGREFPTILTDGGIELGWHLRGRVLFDWAHTLDFPRLYPDGEILNLIEKENVEFLVSRHALQDWIASRQVSPSDIQRLAARLESGQTQTTWNVWRVRPQ
ncbi:MAG: hypothetical protein V2A74_02180 [bacterium]